MRRAKAEDGNWFGVQDPRKRKQIQDRLAQRARRKRLAEAKAQATTTSSSDTTAGADDPANVDYSSDASDVRSIHHIISRETTPDVPESTGSEKRSRVNHDYHKLAGGKKHKSHQPGVACRDGSAIGVDLRQSSRSQSPPTCRLKTFSAQTVSNRKSSSGFSPTSHGSIAKSQSHSKLELPTQTLSPKDFNLSLRYRGKQWHFHSIAHKAKVLEFILLKEEKDVESYPILAFSKNAKKAAFATEDDDGDESTVKDYFRFYTHFMNERFPEMRSYC
ncbi:uncharacterized protein Z518_05379 [Rhinocladiella mackenziei CBS 650.93]|uniref:Uncharacterized protein n=1 Tax=Rhinocladiella mackenziei CBS 650.93 TaxID=1442369 RepID=A0A0D2IFE0_9EURO|nr:uncharacterized protein Z518_05379 [Rhinocladiella mackenziei CBS 650.93]KIX04509.1 hypothetical protein Z518_05379 [Rhinocladiella mackenziei CBS 650.93]